MKAPPPKREACRDERDERDVTRRVWSHLQQHELLAALERLKRAEARHGQRGDQSREQDEGRAAHEQRDACRRTCDDFAREKTDDRRRAERPREPRRYAWHRVVEGRTNPTVPITNRHGSREITDSS